MRARWGVVAFLVGLAIPWWGAVEGQAPALAIVADADVVRHVPTRLHLTGASLGPNLLANPSFSEGFAGPWRLVAGDAGGHVAVSEQSLLFSSSGAPVNGTLQAIQAVPKPDAGPLRLSYRAASIGRDATTAAVIVRERVPGRSIDTSYTHALTPEMEGYEWTWSPQAAGGDVQVILRVRATVGLQQAARIDDIELRKAPTVAWTVEGGAVVSAGGLAATAVFDRLGTHRVSAVVDRPGEVHAEVQGNVTVVAAAPVARLALSPVTPELGTAFMMDAGRSADPDSALRLGDPDLTTWRVSGQETGGAVEAVPSRDALGRPVLGLHVRGAAREGSVAASHTVPIRQPGPATFVVGIQDDGGIQRYEFILRERDAGGGTNDTSYRFGSTQGRESVAAMEWAPQGGDPVSLQVYLRYRVAQGASARVSFIEPNLQAQMEYRFFLDGQPLGASRVPVWPLVLHDADAHEARVEVVDGDGQAANLSIALRAFDSGYVWRLRGPEVLPRWPPQEFDAVATGRTDGIFNYLENPGFGRSLEGWKVGHETGGEASWTTTVEDGSAVLRLVVQAEEAGADFLTQDLDRRCLATACALSFGARLVSGEATVEPILRAVVQGSDGETRPVDLRAPLATGANWTYHELPWPLPTEDVVRLQAYLRVRTAEGARAVVDFRDVRLGPERRFTWTLEGPAGRETQHGATFVPDLRAAAPHRLTVELSTVVAPGRTFDGVHATALDVLPVEVFGTRQGLGLRITAQRGDATVALRHPDGQVAWQLPLARGIEEGSGSPASPPVHVARRETLVLVDWRPGDQLVLANATQASAYSPAGLLGRIGAAEGAMAVATEHRGWDSSLILRVPVDPSVQAVTFKVFQDDRLLATEAARLDDLEARAEVDLPTAWDAEGLRVVAIMEDVWGRSFEEASRQTAAANPLLWPTVAVLGATLLLLVIGLLVEWVNRRP